MRLVGRSSLVTHLHEHGLGENGLGRRGEQGTSFAASSPAAPLDAINFLRFMTTPP